MQSHSGLTTAQVLEVFTEEITAHEGRVTDTFNDGPRLLTRSIIPIFDDVRTGDRVQGGVALKMTQKEVCLYPYVFRLVCSDGAIMAQALQSLQFELDREEPEPSLQVVREGVALCCAPDVFTDNVHRMRSATVSQIDHVLTLLPHMARFSGAAEHNRLMGQIISRFFGDGDQSQFGLANAITSVARDTPDPQLRWNLEELGGAIATDRVPTRPLSRRRAVAKESNRALLVR